MVKKGGSSLDSVIQPFTGETNGAQAAANDGQAAGEFHNDLIQSAGSDGSMMEVPTFSGDSAASKSSASINETLINNVNNAGGDIVVGGKRKSKKNKSKSKKNKSKSKKNKSKSKKNKSKSKSKKNKSKSKSKKSKSKSKKRV